MSHIEFTVNGLKCSVDASTPRDTTLSAYLRYRLALPGTKAMCHQGGCGACLVLVDTRHGTGDRFCVNSCLVLIFSCHGWRITTVEGAAPGAAAVQARVAERHATQCGYCTPGWVMAITSLLHKNLTKAQLERSFGSNTCRCTGYRPLLEVIQSFGSDAAPSQPSQPSRPSQPSQPSQPSRPSQPSQPSPTLDIEDLSICSQQCQRKCSVSEEWTLLTKDEEPIPQMDDSVHKSTCQRKCSVGDDWTLLSKEEAPNAQIDLSFGAKKFHKVFSVDQIFGVLNREGYDSYMFVDGNTGKGLLDFYDYPRVLIDISAVAELKQYSIDQNLQLGANFTLADSLNLFTNLAQHYEEFRYLAEFAKHLEEVAHIPVRQIASLAGNLVMKRRLPFFQSDVYLLLSSVDAVITLRDPHGATAELTTPQFLECDLTGRLITSIKLPPLTPHHVVRTYKITPRQQNALAIVNAAFVFKFDGDHTVVEATIAYGNIRPDFTYAGRTERFLRGKRLYTDEVLQAALGVLRSELGAVDCLPKESAAARTKIALGLFYKFVLSTTPYPLPPRLASGARTLERPLSTAVQKYSVDPALFPLNQPIEKLEAKIQSSGEARYANDLPPRASDVFGAFVTSTIHRGDLAAVDKQGALNIEGVIAIYTAEDIPGRNTFTIPGFQLISEEEEILVSKHVSYYGQPVALVVASSEYQAVRAARLVTVHYKNISEDKPVLTISEGLKDKSRVVVSDTTIDPTDKGEDVVKVVKGVYEIEGQYHYYLEPMSSVCVPVDDRLEIYDSSQWMELTQTAVARMNDMRESDITVIVRRVGGGFGGKISRSARAACGAALAARRLRRVCRVVLPLGTNMTAGLRLPCRTEYEVGVNAVGVIQYLKAEMFEDKGYCINDDISSYTIPGLRNCYRSERWSVRGGNVLTDLSTNTFMRAPGDLEGITTIEHIMHHIAFAVGRSPTSVRLANMREEDNALPDLIPRVKELSDYDARLAAIKEYNKANRWTKKAIEISVMLFPVIYYGNYSAFVSVYRGDGTVTVTSGGIEMGQGLNTKVAQVCAYELGIPVHYITVIPSYSFTAANNVFSGSSITTESVSYACIQACGTLKERLRPLRAELPDAAWKDLVRVAGERQIDLTASFMMADTELTGYSAAACAVIETQLDALTGRALVLRSDVLEDVGVSANPAVDVGQIEGGYVQGLGYFLSEQLVYCPASGRLLTDSALSYRVPLALDSPADFRVYLRCGSRNTRGVLGGKSVPFVAESLLEALDVKVEEFLLTDG